METIDVRTWYLEMCSPPPTRVGAPVNPGQLAPTSRLPLSRYRSLYNTVGRNYQWCDRARLDDPTLAEMIHHDLVVIDLLMVAGEVAGFCELDRRRDGEIELVYFGLLPEFVGRGLGPGFLDLAIGRAWDFPCRRLWLHTCELDHPAALAMYRQAGFRVWKEELVRQTVFPPE